MTNEEHLPIIEVDENSPTWSINTEFNWMTKVACTWKDVKTLRQDMERLSTSPQIEFRSKVLSAVSTLQVGVMFSLETNRVEELDRTG